MKKIKKITATLIMINFIVVIAFTLAIPASVNAGQVDLWGGQENNIAAEIGLGSRDPRLIAASVINVILGFLGIIAVVIVLIAGFKWMTSAGNEEQVTQAKKMLTSGMIGLILVLASWGLSKFVVDLLYNSTQ